MSSVPTGTAALELRQGGGEALGQRHAPAPDADQRHVLRPLFRSTISWAMRVTARFIWFASIRIAFGLGWVTEATSSWA